MIMFITDNSLIKMMTARRFIRTTAVSGLRRFGNSVENKKRGSKFSLGMGTALFTEYVEEFGCNRMGIHSIKY